MTINNVVIHPVPPLRSGHFMVSNDIVKYGDKIIGKIYTKKDEQGNIIEQKTVYIHKNRSINGINLNWVFNCAITDNIII
jgi:hypothetical protein